MELLAGRRVPLHPQSPATRPRDPQSIRARPVHRGLTMPPDQGLRLPAGRLSSLRLGRSTHSHAPPTLWSESLLLVQPGHPPQPTTGLPTWGPSRLREVNRVLLAVHCQSVTGAGRRQLDPDTSTFLQHLPGLSHPRVTGQPGQGFQPGKDLPWPGRRRPTLADAPRPRS